MRSIITIVAVALQIVCLTSSGWANPFTRIISPAPGQTVPGPDVKVQFEAGGATLSPGGWNLHFKLDDQPFQAQYNGNRAHVFKNVLPGSHTIRSYMADALHQAIPGTLSTVTFNVAHYDGANTVTPGQPLLTWNLPQGEYLGVDSMDVTLDFLLENVTLAPGGYQVAYYVDGRRFFIQNGRHRRHITDLAPGLHRIKIELQDCHGDLVPGTFNSGERVIAISPYASTPTTAAAPDAYVRSPRIESIPGSMTVGGSRPPLRAPVTLTDEQKEKQAQLTIARNGTVLRAGNKDPEERVIGEGELPGHEDHESSETSESSDFQVRQGGEQDLAPVDLENAPPSNVKRGSIVVNPEADAKNDDDAVVEVPDEDEVKTTRSATRKRADGSSSKVERTTESLRLADRPSTRTLDKETTRTVHVKDAKTTAPKKDKPSASKGNADDSSSTNSSEKKAESARRHERKERAAKRAENADAKRDNSTTHSRKSDDTNGSSQSQ